MWNNSRGVPGVRALLDTGETITIEAARRLACDADIATVLMRGQSEILDFGRTRRVASNTQYKALVIRDGGCRFPGCDRPPGWTQAHHIVQWPDGGRTDLDNLVLLCLTHHHLIHHQHWRIEGNATNLKIHPPQDPRASPTAQIAAVWRWQRHASMSNSSSSSTSIAASRTSTAGKPL